jgi:hypothetical protein
MNVIQAVADQWRVIAMYFGAYRVKRSNSYNLTVLYATMEQDHLEDDRRIIRNQPFTEFMILLRFRWATLQT